MMTVDAPSATPDELVLVGGYVLSMDPTIGDLARGDVHIRDGEIVAVDRSVWTTPSAR